MKRSILLSLMTVAVVAVFISASTAASFTDSVTSNGNSFTAGTLFLSVDANCGKAPDAQPRVSGAIVCSRGVAFSAANIKPGNAASTKAIVVRNDGSLAGTLTTTQAVVYSDPVNCGAANWTISAPPAAGPIAAAGTITYNASVQLLAAAGNGCQAQSATVNLTFALS